MSRKKHPENTPKVAIAWVYETSKKTIKFLSSYNGVRVTELDKYDPRIGENLLYFRHLDQAVQWMNENVGTPCQIDVRDLTQHGML